MECLDNIVGISNTSCECATQVVTLADRLSTSGIYIDEIEGGLKLSDMNSIDCQDFIAKVRQARQVGTNKFIESIFAQYATDGGFRSKYRSFDGRIGKTNHLRTLTVPRFAGLRLRTKLIRGSSIVLSKIGLIWSAESSITVTIYKGYKGEEGIDFVEAIEGIQTLKNIAVTHNLVRPIELPLYDSSNRSIDYYFLIDTSLYGFPRDNKATCSCGGAEQILKSYMSIGGVSSDSLEGLSLIESSSSHANGLFLAVKIDCSTRAAICNLLGLDISNTIAYAIAYKSQEWLVDEVLKMGNINRFTMLSREHWYGRRNHFSKEFDNRIMWLVQTYSFEKINDCITCYDDRLFKGLIR